jgi:hypothetical protein
MNEIFTVKKLYSAYLDCRETKRKTVNALKFEYNLERNLSLLQRELETKKYYPGRSICFVVKDPSPREIFAASFRDRVVHHILVREVGAMGERGFIFDTFSCRKNKGTHSAIKRLRSIIKKITKNNRERVFSIQLDISGFFMSIDRNILYSLFKKLILKQNKSFQWKEDILWLAKTIIFHKPTQDYVIKGNPSLFDLIPPRKSLFDSPEGKGLPIGNYSSQFFANLCLNELDQFVKRELKCRYYIRYVDDFILLDRNEQKLKDFEGKINLFLNTHLNLELNLNKTKLRPTNMGIDFLGYFVKPDYVLVRRRVVRRLKSKLKAGMLRVNDDKCYNGKIDTDKSKEMLATINSYYGHFGHAFSFNLRKDVYENHLGILKEAYLPKANYLSLKHAE